VAEEGFSRELLQELLLTFGPCGQEDAVRDVCRRELEPAVDETWVDEAGNLVGVIRGGGSPATQVKPDCTLTLTQLGTMYPGNFGLGPVAMLGDRETLCGVLTLGSEHTTKESHQIWETKPGQGDKALDWTNW
jgi:putative aminopeptidase FrvX